MVELESKFKFTTKIIPKVGSNDPRCSEKDIVVLAGIKALRKEHGLSPKEFAELLGASENMIDHWEKAKIKSKKRFRQ